jgi:CubicO group peptidase (beta-lactamase class C family)
MDELRRSVDRLAMESGFSGVVRVDRGREMELLAAYGLAHRGFEVPNEPETRFGIASGTKGFTALTVMSLIDSGILAPGTAARSLLGDDLPLIDEDVTVQHLLSHRSGIGDYFDEELERSIDDYVLNVPVHELVTTEDYLRVLDGYPAKFRPGERFSYCNGGYVVLALIAERAAGVPFHRLVEERVCTPAGMSDTWFLRSDELPGSTAVGYLSEEGLRSNVFHLAVRGSGDGGLYSTAADIASLWTSIFDGRIVPAALVAEMLRPHSDLPERPARYGLGFWLDPAGPIAELHGYDAGASFRSVHDPSTGLSHTVLANTSDGAWPITEHLDDAIIR